MKTKKKAFTLVELVIVIAVIGILAAVLIPTFSGVIERAHVAADQATVGNMNTQLALGSVQYADLRIAVAEEGIDLHTADGARSYLTGNGFKESDFTPKAKDTGYLYDKTECRVLIVKVENGAATEATFPANYASIDFTTIDPNRYEVFTPGLTLTNLTGEHVHTEVDILAVLATCTEKGYTAGKKCSECGAILEGYAEIPATGHTEEVISAVDATCTETGLTAGKQCSVCGEILVEPTEIPATGHTIVDIPAVAATCTEKGYTAGTKCSVCDVVLVEPTETSAKGHTDEDSDNQCDDCSVFLISYSLNGATKTASVSPDNVTVDDGGYRFANGAYLQTEAVTDAVTNGIAVSMWTRKISADWNRMVGTILDTITINSASLQNVNLSMTAGNLGLAKKDTLTSRLWSLYPSAGSTVNTSSHWLMDMYENNAANDGWYYQTYVIATDGTVSMYSNGNLIYRYADYAANVSEINQSASAKTMMLNFLTAAQSSGLRIAECNGSDTYASVKDISVTYAMNDAAVKNAYKEIVGVTIENIGTVGATDYTTAFGGATSENKTLSVGESVTYDFINHNNGGNLWQNFIVKTTDNNNLVRYIRADNYAFQDGNVAYDIGSGYTKHTFTQADLNGARVQMTVTNNGSSITMEATITTAGGVTQEYKLTINYISVTSLNVCLTVENAYLTQYQAQTA